MGRPPKKDSLLHLPIGQVLAVLRKLQANGVTRRDLCRLRTNDEVAQRVAAVLRGDAPPAQAPVVEAAPPGANYDAVSVLGFGPPSDEPLPAAVPGEVVIRYDGWSLQQMRNSPVVRSRNVVWEQDWYNKHAWSKEGTAPGIYRLRIRLPGSRNKTYAEQLDLLRDGEEAAPVCLVVTALLTHLLLTGEDLLRGDWTRCREKGSFGNRVSVRIGGGRLGVRYDYDEGRRDSLWLCSTRMVPSLLKVESKPILRPETDQPPNGTSTP